MPEDHRRPPLSVVIPLYNKEAEIRRTVVSVLEQDYPAAEILVVNDGSTDGSRAAVESIDDPRLRIIDQRNQGECAARNTGIREAANEWIAFLDADDEWLPRHLGDLADLVRDFPDAGACSTGFYFQRESGRIPAPIQGVPNAPWRGVIPDYYDSQFLVWSSSVAVRKDVFETAGYFQPGAAYGGDVDMWLRLAAYFPIAYTTELSAVYHTQASNRVSLWPTMRRTLFPRRSLRQIEQDASVSPYVRSRFRRRIAKWELGNAHRADRRGFRRQARRLARIYAREFGRDFGWFVLRLKLAAPVRWVRWWDQTPWAGR